MNAQRISRLLAGGAAAVALLAAPTALSLIGGQAGAVQYGAQPCYNGVMPYNPYVRSCSLPGPSHKIRGSAPDANAIIACRDHPGCLAWYINGP
jgi:hypothetical protein